MHLYRSEFTLQVNSVRNEIETKQYEIYRNETKRHKNKTKRNKNEIEQNEIYMLYIYFILLNFKIYFILYILEVTSSFETQRK